MTPDEPALEITFRGPAEPASLKQVHGLLARLWASDPGVTPLDRMLFSTAVAEVATNIIKHGGPGVRTDMVLTLRIDSTQVEASFADDGVAVESIAPDEPPPDGLSESGRGLEIARASLDEFTYQRAGESNRWHLVRRRSAPTC